MPWLARRRGSGRADRTVAQRRRLGRGHQAFAHAVAGGQPPRAAGPCGIVCRVGSVYIFRGRGGACRRQDCLWRVGHVGGRRTEAGDRGGRKCPADRHEDSPGSHRSGSSGGTCGDGSRGDAIARTVPRVGSDPPHRAGVPLAAGVADGGRGTKREGGGRRVMGVVRVLGLIVLLLLMIGGLAAAAAIGISSLTSLERASATAHSDNIWNTFGSAVRERGELS